MSKKNEEKQVGAFFVGTVLTFLFNNFMLLIYGLLKTRDKKR